MTGEYEYRYSSHAVSLKLSSLLNSTDMSGINEIPTINLKVLSYVIRSVEVKSPWGHVQRDTVSSFR